MFVRFNCETTVKQDFSLSYFVTSYIKKYPSTVKVYLSLIKSCKYFYSPNDPIPFYDINVQWFGKPYNFNVMKSINLQNNARMIWIAGNLINPPNLSLLLKNVHRCDIKKLIIYSENISFDEFKLLTESKMVEHFSLEFSTIKFDNNLIVSIEEIIRQLPNLRVFKLQPNYVPTFTSETTKNIIDLIDAEKLESFTFYNIPESFDFSTFSNFMQKYSKILFFLSFSNPLSESYITQLRNFVQQMIEIEAAENLPLLLFNGQNEWHFQTLLNSYYTRGGQF